jgi:phytoene dehydrogenase-like protein
MRRRDLPGVLAEPVDLVVLGAGPAGVGAAYRTARAGHRVVVLERAPGPGGAAASFEVDGIRVDHGSHRLHPAIQPRILDDLRGLLGDELQRRPRNGRILLEGRWIRFPLRPADLARRLPPSFAAGAAADAATAWARRPRADTFAETLRAGLGPTMCERFYFPYARKLWGLDPSELAGEQARRRVSAGSPGRLLARVARGAGRDSPWFWYPRGGFGAICERLAAAAADAGAELRYRTAPRGGHRGPGRRGDGRGPAGLVDPAPARPGPDDHPGPAAGGAGGGRPARLPGHAARLPGGGRRPLQPL